ncbi:hypothetical protein P175DRAFT_0499468 [Aspergillus ochraceoroseus IBT 24754]|uniref:Uncharacterized protein n=1 Tax=Aspergillus ochraceoroseus IBT 24754 TaxID=1392256 RepID=A0A2T5M309_9EURO|nr:uncharacterized protein P175DRAFT_0499468 [Aspergillus ochraceoroseus IBT 24754]PTU22917.1 hypothetical protein P175DRAFT_0499468 [Aspergillus ochraceoroseus IBT 24754]
MAETAAMGDTAVCSPTFSIFSPFIPTLIKQRLPPLAYSLYPSERSAASRSTLFATAETPRPFSVGSRSSAPSSDDSFHDISDDDARGSNHSPDAMGVVLANYEMDSGLRWNRVTPALNLLRHAGYEAQQPRCDARLVRVLYLNAVTYLLTALPEDLTSEEAATLRRSLPEKVKASLPVSSGSGVASPQSPRTPSYLHRLLASSIVCFCLLLQFLMPFVKMLLVHLYQYERSYRVTERVTAMALSVADHISKGSVTFGSTVVNMYDGQPGVAAAVSAASWWVEGIAGGIYEGVGEGMTILGFSGPPFDGEDK